MKNFTVKFQSGSYENESECKNFIKSIAEYFLKQDRYSKLVRINFIAILCDVITNTSITEQKEVYAFLVHPDSMQPTLEFFGCLGLDSNQGATRIFDAVIVTFQKHSLHPFFKK